MKIKLCIYLQPNYLTRTAIARDSETLKSAVLHFVFFMILINKMQQSAAQRCLGTFELRVLPFGKTSGTKLLNLLNSPTDRTFGNRWSRYKEPNKNKAEAYRVYVELILRSDAGGARHFKRRDGVVLLRSEVS